MEIRRKKNILCVNTQFISIHKYREKINHLLKAIYDIEILVDDMVQHFQEKYIRIDILRGCIIFKGVISFLPLAL